MLRRTLIDFFADLSSTPGEFVVYDDGYRSWSYSYADVAQAARAFAERLRAQGIVKGQAVAVWAENRAEWIIAMWGCLLEGIVLVPIDYRASADFLERVATIVDARAVLVGDTVDASSLGSSRPVWPIAELREVFRPTAEAGSFRTKAEATGTTERDRFEATADTVAEIIFTSGATAEPKGVVITHRNILANIIPIEREMAKYKKYARPFLPIRFLNLLPLSHMFGQAMATFVPPMLPGVVIFTRSYAPEDIVRQIHSRRISVLVCVPKMLEVLKEHILRTAPEAADAPAKMHWTNRWWKYRRIHGMFGFKFWAVVVGAAPLDPDLELFWSRLGFLVVQGYGLTETAPIVTLNHPLHSVRGAVGKPIPGVEVRIAADGEILVRGENVTSGYFNAPEQTRAAFEDGWFHTGDIGELDLSGQLHIRGRKKEMIVTPEGLNVFPDDVERVLNEVAGVTESAVVGASLPGSTAERVQAVIVAAPGTDLDEVIRQANSRLQDHQKIRAAALWPGEELPRTEGTRKLKRRELQQWVVAGSRAGAGTPSHTTGHRGAHTVAAVIERFAPGRAITSSTTIDELGLSSLERVELMMALEESLQVTVDESRFAAAVTVADLEEITRPIAGMPEPGLQAGSESHPTVGATTGEPIDFPEWNRSAPVRALRRVSLPTWILPLARPFVSLEVRGLEHLEGISSAVVFAANHQSHLDTPVILQALPARWRYRVAPAMAKEFFKPHFYPDQFSAVARLTNSLNYYLAVTFFNAFPLPQRETGTRQTLRYIGHLIGDGYSVLIFPEGRRTEKGEIGRFQPGVGMIAARLDVPVVPVRLEGLDRILHHTWKFPQRGRARVLFGAPMLLKGNDYAANAALVEEAVRRLD
jgi:long-chain acyl-CoA synthetase